MARVSRQFGSNASSFAACFPVDATAGGHNSAIIRKTSANRFFEIANFGHLERDRARAAAHDLRTDPNRRRAGAHEMGA